MFGSRRIGRRASALGLALVMTLAVGAVVGARAASAATVATDYACSLAGLSGSVTVPFEATITPDPVVAGGPISLAAKAGTPVLPGFETTLSSLVIDMDRPAPVSSITGVTFAGGNLVGSWQESATGVRLTFTGPVTTSSAVLPVFTLTGAVAAGATGTVAWEAPVTASAQLSIGGTLAVSECRRAAGAAPIAAVAVGSPTTTTTTTAPATTVTTGPTTTAATSTTTSSTTTTTTAPTTTTTTTAPATPRVTIGDVTVAENQGPATFTVTLDRPAAARTAVSYATANGTAVSGADYTAKSGTIIFTAGQSSITVSVSLRNDAVAEPVESFTVALSLAGSGLDPALAHKLTGTATVTDDDTATLRVVDHSVNEGQRTRTITVTVRMTRSTSTQVVTWTTEDGTAVAGADYQGASGSVTFAPGEVSKAVTLTILGDRVPEADEWFSLRLVSVAGDAVLGDATGLISLANDD